MAYSDIIAARAKYWRLSKEAKVGLIAYSKGLEDAGLPVLLDLGHISASSGYQKSLVAAIVDRPQAYYREFSIPKRSGGRRTLLAPRPYLAHLQRWILRSILEKIPVHVAAHGFVSERGIVSNARAHCGAGTILKMDVADFFGSITRASVEETFLQAGYSPKVSYFLSRITTVYGRLPQGAPTSPYLSNIFMFDFDEAISKYCSELDLVYTRYADDITISGRNVSSATIGRVKFELTERDLTLSATKTRIAHSNQKQIVTGVSISSGVLRLPRERRRKLRQTVHLIGALGLENHKATLGIRDPIYKYRLAGELMFWLQIEPNNPTATRGIELLSTSR